jgi:hypothetical protein
MSSSILDATTGVAYSTLSAAITGSSAGDTIDIPAGLYVDTFPKITHDLTLQAVGGLAHLESPTPIDGQAILVTDANVTVDGLELSGAVVGSGNGAGIREESGSLTVLNSYIHDNQDGILTSGVLPGATLTIDNTEFNHNGLGPPGGPATHNLYAGQLDLVKITNSYFTDAVVGHDIKSGALDTVIEHNRIQDPTGTTSYEIDLQNGNVATIENNVIEKGPNAQAGALIHYGTVGSPVAANSSLTITGNTVIDDKQTTPFVLDQANLPDGSIVVPTVTGNTFYGLPGGAVQVVQGVSGDYTANTFDPNASDAPALDAAAPFAMSCYREGTLIATERGEVAVEALREGDRVASAFGGSAPVIWIGHARIDCRRHPCAEAVLPVRVAANAFGEGLPRRDLWLSPEHGVYVDDVLIPIRTLLNGRSIRQEVVAFVRYFHVELPAHDVILAEGLPAESYLDTGSRGAFANGGPMREVPAGYAQRVWEAEACAPHITHGPIHARVAARLRVRAGAVKR